jgi:uncharacterized protein YydD (DUF2326 family)
MKIIERNEESEKKEQQLKKEEEAYLKLLDEGAKSDYGKAIEEIFNEEIEIFEEEMKSIEVAEMEAFHSKTKKEKEQVLQRMSSRYNIRIGIVSILQQIKSRLF